MNEQELDSLYVLLHRFKKQEIKCVCRHSPKCKYKGKDNECHILGIMEDVWERRQALDNNDHEDSYAEGVE